jgi:protein-tyrosine phosphatase
MANEAAKIVTRLVRDGKIVLVCCAQGRNRSGLITALAIHKLTGWDGKTCRRVIQERRKDALMNLDFSRFIDRIPERPLMGS